MKPLIQDANHHQDCYINKVGNFLKPFICHCYILLLGIYTNVVQEFAAWNFNSTCDLSPTKWERIVLQPWFQGGRRILLSCERGRFFPPLKNEDDDGNSTNLKIYVIFPILNMGDFPVSHVRFQGNSIGKSPVDGKPRLLDLSWSLETPQNLRRLKPENTDPPFEKG